MGVIIRFVPIFPCGLIQMPKDRTVSLLGIHSECAHLMDFSGLGWQKTLEFCRFLQKRVSKFPANYRQSFQLVDKINAECGKIQRRLTVV